MKYEYHHDTYPYSDNEFLMQNWMHCVVHHDAEGNRVVDARCTTEKEARALVKILTVEGVNLDEV